MGLDISACSRVKRVKPFTGWENGADALYEQGLRPVSDKYDFPHHLGSLQPGWYEVEGEETRFRAGSYSGYNAFREWISRVALGVPPEVVWESIRAGQADFKNKPFVSLIDFTDCDGVIGPEVCAELHRDFVENREKFEKDSQWGYDGGYYGELYDYWTTAFELGSDNGMVVFH